MNSVFAGVRKRSAWLQISKLPVKWVRSVLLESLLQDHHRLHSSVIIVMIASSTTSESRLKQSKVPVLNIVITTFSCYLATVITPGVDILVVPMFPLYHVKYQQLKIFIWKEQEKIDILTLESRAVFSSYNQTSIIDWKIIFLKESISINVNKTIFFDIKRKAFEGN